MQTTRSERKALLPTLEQYSNIFDFCHKYAFMVISVTAKTLTLPSSINGNPVASVAIAPSPAAL